MSSAKPQPQGFTVTHSTVLRFKPSPGLPRFTTFTCTCLYLYCFTDLYFHLDLPWLALPVLFYHVWPFTHGCWRTVLRVPKWSGTLERSRPHRCWGEVERAQNGARSGLLWAWTGSACPTCRGWFRFTLYFSYFWSCCWWWWCFTFSADGSALPSSTDGAKPGVEDKKKVVVKSPPSSAQKALSDLRPFLRFADGRIQMRKLWSPKLLYSLLYLGQLRGHHPWAEVGPSQSMRRLTKEKQSKTPRSRSRPLSPGSRDRVVGCILGQPELAGFTHELDPAPIYYTSHSALPTNIGHPKWKQEFLQWTIDDCRLSWKKGELAWVNLHIGMYFYSPSAKYPLDHFRRMAACSVSGDPTLPARFCCWTCRQPGEGGSVKSLWPSFTAFSWHWNLTHARQLHKDWVSLALRGGVTLQDLAWSLLGIDLEDTPLPYHPDALRYLPRTLPPREQGHNPKIYGRPWNIERPFTPSHRALPAGPSHFTPTPPSHPPPSHVLPSLDSPLNAVNTSLASLPSSPPVAKAPPPMAPGREHVGAKSKSASPVVDSHDPASSVVPASIKSNGSRFHLGEVARGFTRIGWQNPLQMWEQYLKLEIKSFIFPSADVHSYSEARERWHLTFCKRSSMLQWLLYMEEHCFYLFLIKSMASRSILMRSSLSLQDRELSLAMSAVCSDDLKEELQHYSSFRHDDEQLPYVCSVLEHCKALIHLRLPLQKDSTFPLAPNWNAVPTDDSWQRSFYKRLSWWGSVLLYRSSLGRLACISCTVVPCLHHF